MRTILMGMIFVRGILSASVPGRNCGATFGVQVIEVPKLTEPFAVLLAGDDGLVGWTRRGTQPRQLAATFGRLHRPLNIHLCPFARLVRVSLRGLVSRHDGRVTEKTRPDSDH